MVGSMTFVTGFVPGFVGGSWNMGMLSRWE